MNLQYKYNNMNLLHKSIKNLMDLCAYYLLSTYSNLSIHVNENIIKKFIKNIFYMLCEL